MRRSCRPTRISPSSHRSRTRGAGCCAAATTTPTAPDSLGQLQTGLFFIAFVRDPRTNFYPILDRMTKSDALQEYLKHEASALFAIPPGIKEGDTMVAASLFS